ncbi:MAG: hypothetical protein IKB02_07975 [Clostridia bacterium]|nr:hypothetical protein [Clostridia bacterium]
MKKGKRIVFSSIITLAIVAAAFYITLPPINLQSTEFWGFLTFSVVVFGVSNLVLSINLRSAREAVGHTPISLKNNKFAIVVIVLALLPMLVILVGNISSSTFFNAKAYANVITVENAIFEEDMPETDTVSNIALMDSNSANTIGNRTLGALSNVVSQYEIAPNYAQINYLGTPKKVANLEYVGFFKWLGNRDTGIPGFVMVDPVNISAEYVELTKPMKYVDSAFFNEDLLRAVRFRYPTKILHNFSFEIDEAGNPYYIIACAKPKVGLFGALDINEVIKFDPCSGESEIYSVDSTPSWIDTVYTGYLASEKYDWYGLYANGFWNSVIGNKDCKVTTDDFGYIMIGDDVWYFTGVTSITSDESNIGFIISNARTGEYKFYPIIGAEEYSAMRSAEGEVQEKRYTASFPSLINISGEATYIMVLKDDSGIVRLYALVNVEQYTVVATGETQESAKRSYIEKLKQEGILDDELVDDPDLPVVSSATITVSDIKMPVINGETVVYITDEKGIVYKEKLSQNESLILLGVGDKIEVFYSDTSIERIKEIESFNAVNK